MTEDNPNPAPERTHHEAYASADDLLVRLAHTAEGTYECITVNSSWPEKGLVEGDVVLCARGHIASEGSVVLIEHEGSERLGLVSTPGFLETPRGNRPLEATENIVAVGVALVRNLQKQA